MKTPKLDVDGGKIPLGLDPKGIERALAVAMGIYRRVTKDWPEVGAYVRRISVRKNSNPAWCSKWCNHVWINPRRSWPQHALDFAKAMLKERTYVVNEKTFDDEHRAFAITGLGCAPAAPLPKKTAIARMPKVKRDPSLAERIEAAKVKEGEAEVRVKMYERQLRLWKKKLRSAKASVRALEKLLKSTPPDVRSLDDDTIAAMLRAQRE